jgi:hypothetical protein
MGALTAKTREFTYRVWEQKSSVELDDTEVSLFKLRSENLKAKRIRYLPINYWLSDKKRFAKETAVVTNTSIAFKERRLVKLNIMINEAKYIHYLTSSIKGYKKILDKLRHTYINVYSAKKTTTSFGLKNITTYDDLLINRVKVNRSHNLIFDQENFNKDIILLTNPRVDSPALNAYLYKHSDNYNFISVSSFVSNLKKLEIPLSTYVLTATAEGYYNLKGKTIISSCLINLPRNLPTINIITPLYMQEISLPYRSEEIIKSSVILASKPRQIFKPSFVGNTWNSHFNSVTVQRHIFDRFTLKKFDHKVVSRLSLNLNLIIARKQEYYRSIQYIKY